jgi:N-acetyl sugar amidotransferase
MKLTRCNTCVMPTTRPDTAFIDGKCSACVHYEKRIEVDWAQREAELIKILEFGRKFSSGGYDCIVPSSGGKDSTYQVLKLIEYGARPLVVTATTCHLTPLGRKNIDNLARFATTIEWTVNKDVRRKLNRLGLEIVGDISHPEHMAIFSVPFRAARDFGIPLIFYGENPQREYGSPLGAEQALMMTKRWVSEFGGLLGMRPKDFIGMDDILAEDMADYMMPDDSEIADIEAYFLGQFIPWDSRGNAKLAIDHGFTTGAPSPANWWSFENLDNAQTGIHDHGMFRKYGFGRLCQQISVDVRRGLVSRDRALDIVCESDGLFPYRYAGVTVDEMLAALDQDMDWLISNLDAHTDWSLFEGRQGDRPTLKEFADEVVA